MKIDKTIYAIQRQSLSEQVYHYIKRLILSGEIRGGEKIPEEKVAQQFGVSRTPIREALKRLEEYGLIRINREAMQRLLRLNRMRPCKSHVSARNWKHSR